LDNAAWTVKDNLSISANATTSPDGTTNADKLVEDSSNNQHRVYRSISGNNKSFSFFAKAGERSWVAVLSDYGFTWFDIANGTVGTVASGATASITAFGNGWFRCVVYNTHNSYGAMIQLALANNGTSYQGNGTSGAFVWGCQMEASSYPTSLISTTSASATRVADACFKTSATALIGQTEGTFFVETEYDREGASASARKLISANDGSSANLIDIYVPSGQNTLQARIRANSTTLGGINTSSVPLGKVKIAYAYKANDYVLYINGVQIGTVTTGGSITFSSAVSTLQIGDGEAGADELTGKIGQAVVFKTRLSNADLIALTTI
jgi:hypothetical protein